MFSENRVVACECERIYDVIADVARYPEFVPGWLAVRVLEQGDSIMIVEQHLGFGAFGTWVRSRAVFERPVSIQVRPVDEYATGLNLEWYFQRQADAGCTVSLRIFGQSSNRLLASALDAAGEHAGQRLVDIFAARSAALHGAPCNPQR